MAVPNEEIYGNDSSTQQMPLFELPNQKIEVKVELTKPVNSVLEGLQKNLRRHNMDEVIPDPGTKNAITVSGIPPVNGFNEYTVVAIVQRSDSRATLLSSRILS